MKNFLLIGLLTLLSGISWSQCATGNPGTNCSGPLTVQPQSGNTGQSAITLVDLGLAVPAPAVGQYTLSIASGMLLESDNGNSYHSLVGTRGEIVIGQRLGVLMNEFDPAGGLAEVSAEKRSLAQGPAGCGVMIGKIASAGLYSPLTIETMLDPAIQPFLHDHQIDGTPVLPGVMGIEAFAEAALCLLPGWHVEAIEEVNFLAPFKFYRNEPRPVTVEAVIHPHGDGLIAD